MNIKKILTAAFFFFASSPVLAASPYPELAGITIGPTTTTVEYIIYFFNLLVAAGTFIAVVMVIMAGIEWVTSSGNPSKVESAKGKIANTLLGVGVLMGCYLILNTINSQLTSIKIDDLRCEHGLVVSMKYSDEKVKEECIDTNQGEIAGTIANTLKWKFPDKYLLKVYTYPEANYKGVPIVFDCRTSVCSGEIPSTTKSIYFVLNNPGIYLYDEPNYGTGVKSYPRFITKSVPDLSKLESFDNFTKSLEIINPPEEQKINYQAVVFKDQNYQGRCAFVAYPILNMDQSPSGFYTDKVGNKAISSIIVTKGNSDPAVTSEERGEIILYTKTDCGKSNTDPTKQIKACHIPINSMSRGQIDILKQCSNFTANSFVLGDEVMSFEITGAAGLVLSTATVIGGSVSNGENTYCQYFDKSDLKDGTCLSSILDTPIYTVGGITPKSFVIIPDN